MIKNLGAKLACRYKIKIGGLGKEKTSSQGKTFRLPEKFDHFLVATNERDSFGNLIAANDIMRVYGPKPTELNVILFSNDIEDVYNDWFAYYTGKSVQCKSMDGEVARWNSLLAPAPESLQAIGDENGFTLVRCYGQQCPIYQNENCKINAILRCLIAEAQTVGGVAELRTTSINSALQLRASMALISRTTGGYIAGIPLKLKLQPKTVQLPQGGQTVVYITHLEYPGSLIQLKELALEYQKKVAIIDKDLKMVAASSFEETPEEIAQVVEEFYPQNNQASDLSARAQAGKEEKGNLPVCQGTGRPEPVVSKTTTPSLHSNTDKDHNPVTSDEENLQEMVTTPAEESDPFNLF